jgi:hypothetical protein
VSDEKKLYQNETIVLDGKIFDSATFKNCRMIFRGGIPPIIKGCTFNNAQFRFEDGARNTIDLLRLLASAGKGGEDQVVIDILGIKRAAEDE